MHSLLLLVDHHVVIVIVRGLLFFICIVRIMNVHVLVAHALHFLLLLLLEEQLHDLQTFPFVEKALLF